jgi:tetratricopeptide (TPR) repeat protein
MLQLKAKTMSGSDRSRRVHLFCLFLCFLVACFALITSANQLGSTHTLGLAGRDAYEQGLELQDDGDYEGAADMFWSAIMKGYQADKSFQLFLNMYSHMGKLEQGYLKIAKQYFQQKNDDSARKFVASSIEAQPTYEAYCLLVEHSHENTDKEKYLELASQLVDPTNAQDNLHLGNEYFGIKKYPKSLYFFNAALNIDPNLDYAAASAAYLRSNIADWGPGGEWFESDMRRLTDIISKEKLELDALIASGSGAVHSSAVHPHMSLAYPIDPALKLVVARTHALTEVQLVKKYNLTIHKHDYRKYRKESSQSSFRLKVGYSSANFKSKASANLVASDFTFSVIVPLLLRRPCTWLKMC